MCSCSVNLMGQGSNIPCACELNIENTPMGVIQFVLDNNEQDVRKAMMRQGIDPSFMSKKQIADFLYLSFSQGYDISSMVSVAYKNDADNYTGGLVDKINNTTSMKLTGNDTIDTILGIVLGGLGAYYGSSVFMGNGNNTPPPQPAPMVIPTWVYLIGGLMFVVLIVALLRR